MAGKLPTLDRSSPSKYTLSKVASQLEEFPSLELLKSILLEQQSDPAAKDSVLDAPIALIPAALGHSQTLPRHCKEMQKLQRIHVQLPESSPPTSISRVSNARSHISAKTHRCDSKATLNSPQKTNRKPASSYKPRLPSVSARQYRPSSSLRSSSVAAKRGTFLSYLLEKSISFTASQSDIKKPNGEYRSSSVRYSGQSQFSAVEKPTDIISYTGDYHGGDREGDGEAQYRNGDLYRGAWARGKRFGYGEYVYRALGLVYKGEWADDRKHGRGVVVCANGDTVESQWNEDQMADCRGTIEYVSLGAEYSGDMKDANKHGDGHMKYSGGNEYRGSFQDDRRHGPGVITFIDGSLFEGAFEHDYASGPGLLQLKNALLVKVDMYATKGSARAKGVVWPRDEKEEKLGNLDDFYIFATTAAVANNDIVWKSLSVKEFEAKWPPISGAESGRFHSGSLSGLGLAMYGEFGFYYGEFHDGKRSGFGRMTYSNENSDCAQVGDTYGEYEGQWRRDKRHGSGKMKWKNGIVYQGQYRDDHRHNVQGVMTFPTGDKYSGMWVNDLMHGMGRYEDINGVAFSGKFVGGYPSREGTIDSPEGHYEGELREMKPNGHGRFTYPSGDVYIGEMVEGVRWGTGKMHYKDGSEYAGEWREGLREGWGTYKTATEVYEGAWARDHKHGSGLLRGASGQVVFDGMWRDGVKEGRGTAGPD